MIFFNSCKKSDDIKPIDIIPPNNSTYKSDTSFKIVAYMPGYRDPAVIPDAKFKMITHLFFAFLNINPTGDGSVLPLSATERTRFNSLKAKAAANNVKFGISIMGAESVFATMAGSTMARANFVKNVVDFAKTNNLAGIDIDWEYPRTINGAPNTNYTSLMRELSAELHKGNKFLSAAITPAVYPSTNKDAIQSEAFQYVDFFNIMQYDGAGYDTAEPLNHASLKMTNASLEVWLNAKKMPREKAILGMPLYGKDSTGSSISFKDIEAKGGGLTVNVAKIEGKSYGYNGINLIKQKTQIAKDRCNGIMFWELAHDSNTNNSLIKAANDQLGRNYQW